jgi:hypothetical protein
MYWSTVNKEVWGKEANMEVGLGKSVNKEEARGTVYLARKYS